MNTPNSNKFTNFRQSDEFNSDFISRNYKSLKYYTDKRMDPNVNMDHLLSLQKEQYSINNKLHFQEVVSDRQKTILPPMPLLTNPSLQRGPYNVKTENSLQQGIVRDRKSCNPKEYSYYTRTNEIFTGLPITFNTRSTPMVPKTHNLRAGVNTRDMNYEYKN